MAYSRRRKTRGRKRKVKRRTRKVYKKKSYTGMSKSLNSQLIRIQKTMQFTGPSGEAGGTFSYNDPYIISATSNYTTYTSGVFTFTIGQLLGYSIYQQMYDQYKINGVKLTFKYMSGSELDVTTQAAGGCTEIALMIWNDYDDKIVPPTTVTEWQSRVTTGRCKKKIFPSKYNSLSYYVRPRLLNKVLDSAGTYNGVVLQANPFVDFDSSFVPEYHAVKWMIQANPSTPIAHSFRVTAKFYCTFKDRKF